MVFCTIVVDYGTNALVLCIIVVDYGTKKKDNQQLESHYTKRESAYLCPTWEATLRYGKQTAQRAVRRPAPLRNSNEC